MCGIVGYIGIDEPTSFLISALEHLEYRGYDSAGIAVCGCNKINLLKKKGRISVLKNELKIYQLKARDGLFPILGNAIYRRQGANAI